jgi:hypothetical protein
VCNGDCKAGSEEAESGGDKGASEELLVGGTAANADRVRGMHGQLDEAAEGEYANVERAGVEAGVSILR